MKTGQINSNVGFSATAGSVRQLTVREQLLRVKNFVGINEIVHPIHGRLVVDRNKLEVLLRAQDGHLIRFKRSQFE